MELQLACIADAANISQENKLNILGEFDILWSTQVPVEWPCMVYVAKLRVSEADGSELALEIRVVSEDGKMLFQATQKGRIQRVGPATGELPNAVILLPIQNPSFPAWGTYTFELRVNGTIVGPGVLLHVRKRPQATSPANQ